MCVYVCVLCDLILLDAAQVAGRIGYSHASRRGERIHHDCPGYDSTPSDGEAQVVVLWGMWSTLSLFQLHSDPEW